MKGRRDSKKNSKKHLISAYQYMSYVYTVSLSIFFVYSCIYSYMSYVVDTFIYPYMCSRPTFLSSPLKKRFCKMRIDIQVYSVCILIYIGNTLDHRTSRSTCLPGEWSKFFLRFFFLTRISYRVVIVKCTYIETSRSTIPSSLPVDRTFPWKLPDGELFLDRKDVRKTLFSNSDCFEGKKWGWYPLQTYEVSINSMELTQKSRTWRLRNMYIYIQCF